MTQRTALLDMVSGDGVVWPAGQTVYPVVFRDTHGSLPKLGMLRLEMGTLTRPRLLTYDFRQTNYVLTSGQGISCNAFNNDRQAPSTKEFPMPDSPHDVVATFVVDVAPVADTTFMVWLEPHGATQNRPGNRQMSSKKRIAIAKRKKVRKSKRVARKLKSWAKKAAKVAMFAALPAAGAGAALLARR